MKAVAEMPSNGRHGNSLYDWAKLLDGTTWELVVGEDFACTASTFRGQAHNRARMEGKKIKTAIRGDRLYLRAVSA